MAGFSSKTRASLGTSSAPSPSSRRGAWLGEEAGAARHAGGMPWQRRETPAPGRPGRMGGDVLDEGSIGRSVRAVERAVENFTALQENRNYYRDLAAELRKAFEDEKEHAAVFAQQLAEAERAKRSDRERAARAESRLEQSAQTIRELERQLASVRAETDRLVHTIARLMAGERGRGGKEVSMAELLAA